METILLASAIKPLMFIQYQVVYEIKQGEKYVRSFNLLSNGKILKKVYLDHLIKAEDESEIEMITSEMIRNVIYEKGNKKFSKSGKTQRKKSSVDHAARVKAAHDILEMFNL